jgi:hypothetical protein
MTDDLYDSPFGRDLRSMLAARAPDRTPESLRTFVLAVPGSQRTMRTTHPGLRRFALVAAGAAVAVLAIGVYFSQSRPPVPAATTPRLTPVATEQPTPASSRGPVVELQIIAGDHVPTPNELQTISEVLFQRLAVYVPTVSRDDIDVASDGSGTVKITLNHPTLAPGESLDALIPVLSAAGDVQFFPIETPHVVQPQETIDPSLHPLFSGTDVDSVRLGLDETHTSILEIQVNRDAADALSSWSGANLGSILAITVDGEIVSAPTVNGHITDGAMQIALGGPNDLYGKPLEALLKSGPLPYRLQLVVPTFPLETTNP